MSVCNWGRWPNSDFYIASTNLYSDLPSHMSCCSVSPLACFRDILKLTHSHGTHHLSPTSSHLKSAYTPIFVFSGNKATTYFFPGSETGASTFALPIYQHYSQSVIRSCSFHLPDVSPVHHLRPKHHCPWFGCSVTDTLSLSDPHPNSFCRWCNFLVLD